MSTDAQGNCPTPPLVSIIIVTSNGGELLLECLRSVYRQSYRPVEVILVDNASTDGSVDRASAEFPNLMVVRNSTNRGFAEGNNLGIERATGEFVALLNDDTVVDGNWLVKLTEMLARSGAAVVTSKVITEGIPAAWYEMNGTLNYLGYNIMRVFHDLSQIFFAGGASLLFHRDTIGTPFLSEYFLYHEDVYLSWRLRLLGYTVAMAQESLVEHHGSATTKKQPTMLTTFYQERNRILNCLLFYEKRTLWRLLPYFLADAVAKALLSIAGRRKSLRGILRAYWWLFSHRGWIRENRARFQVQRTVDDRPILELMSCKVIDSNTAAARVVNMVSRRYADIVGLRYYA